MTKQAKDLKLGDNIYFLNWDTYDVHVRKVTKIEEENISCLKITWDEESILDNNYGYIQRTGETFHPEYSPDERLYDMDVTIYLDKEEVISILKSKFEDNLKKLL